MTTIIVLNGPPRAGKDTFIEMVNGHLYKRHIPTNTFSSINPVRHMLSTAGIDVSAKTEADRKLLSVVGDACQEHSKWKIRQCFHELNNFQTNYGERGVMFLHVREPVLIDEIRNLCLSMIYPVRFITVFLDSVRAQNVTSNLSDAGVRAMQYDMTLYNNGTKDDLFDTARDFVQTICGVDHPPFHL